MENNEIIKKALEENYSKMYDIPESQKKKLIRLLTMRACRFFVESQLAQLTLEEDLEKGNLDYGLEYEKKMVEDY